MNATAVKKYRPTHELRLAKVREPGPRVVLDGPAAASVQAVEMCKSLCGHEWREVVGVILIDPQLAVVGSVVIFTGGISQCTVDPRGVFAPAIIANAASVIVFHCHPSGKVEPSRDDVELTKKLIAGGEVLSIPVLDHVIVGSTTHGRVEALSLRSARSELWA